MAASPMAAVSGNPLVTAQLEKGPSYTLPAILALFATLIFGALLLLQWMEYDLFHNQPPTVFPNFAPLAGTAAATASAGAAGAPGQPVTPEALDAMAAGMPSGMSSGAAVGTGIASIVIMAVGAIVGLLMLISTWVIFSKAGKPGIAAIIPIWNLIVFVQVAGKPAWWFILYLLLAPIIYLILCFGVAKNFGKGAGFALGLIFLPIIFFPVLAFGDAQHMSRMQLPEETA